MKKETVVVNEKELLPVIEVTDLKALAPIIDLLPDGVILEILPKGEKKDEGA